MSILSFILNIKTPTDFSDNSYDINSESKKNFFNKDFVDIGSMLYRNYYNYIFALIINYNIRLGKIPYSMGKYFDFTNKSEIINQFSTFPKLGGEANMIKDIMNRPELYIYVLILNDMVYNSNNSNMKEIDIKTIPIMKEIDIKTIPIMHALSGSEKIFMEKFKKNRDYYIYALILNDIYQSAFLFPKNFAVQSDVFKGISRKNLIVNNQSIQLPVSSQKKTENFFNLGNNIVDDIRYHRMGTF
jgi:hypothetical protein